MNRQCSFGQTNNPLDNVFQVVEENGNIQTLSNQQPQPIQQTQIYQDNAFNFNSQNGNSFQQTFNYEWNQALSGNGLAQKNTSFSSDDYIQNLLNQYRIKPSQEEEDTIDGHNNPMQSQQVVVQGQQKIEDVRGDNNITDFHRLQELDYKRIQTEESSSDSIIYKGEEVDKILSRYSFQMLQENNDIAKISENNQLQNTPGSLSYSVNDIKSCSDNMPFQSGAIGDQDLSINFNLKPPLGYYGQVQCFNEKPLSSNTVNLQGQNPNTNQLALNQLTGINGIGNNNSNISGSNFQQINLSTIPFPQNPNGQGTTSSNINVQECINLSKSDLFSNNLSGIKWSLMSQGSNATYFPFSTNTASNISGTNNQKQITSHSGFPSSTTSNQQLIILPQQQHQQQQQLNPNSTNHNSNIVNQNMQMNQLGLNLNFQKQNSSNITNHLNDQSNKCQECTLSKQQISFLQIQLKESQEREETQKKLNDSLMVALNQVQDDKSQTMNGSSSGGRSEILRQHYEKEIQQLREQMKSRQKQQETVSKELVKKFDELEEQKRSLDLQIIDFKKKIEQQNMDMNEAQSNLSKKDYQIYQFNEEIKKLQQLALSADENKIINLERKIESIQKNHKQEIQSLQKEAESEIQKYNTLLAKTIDQFESKIRSIIGEKNLIEKANASNSENNSDLRSKLNDEIAKLRQQKDAALKQIEQQQKTIDQSKIQATAQTTLLSQIEEQERTIEQLQGISLAHDQLQIQFAQQGANIKHLQLKIKEIQTDYQDLKLKRDNDMKSATSKYAELASRLVESQSNHEKMKKDFQRKSAMIIREILNKDMKIRQLTSKIQMIQGNSSPFSSSNGSHLQTGNQMKRDKSPLSRLLQEDKTLSDHPNFIEFNKSQLLNSPPHQEKTSSTTPTNGKTSQIIDNEKLIEGLQSRSRSPVGRGTYNTQQFWQNFMDMSNISSDNLLNGAQQTPFNMAEEDEENMTNLNFGNLSNINPDDLKNKYVTLLHSRNILEDTINDLKMQLNKKNELEVCLKNEVRFIVEYLVQTLADQIVIDIREKENQIVQGFSSSSSSGMYDPSKIYGNEEDRIVRETDKLLKQHIIKLQQKAISSQMIECYNILNSILGQNIPQPKPKQNLQEKIPLQLQDNKVKSLNKQSSSQQEQTSSSSLTKKAKKLPVQKLILQNKSNSPFIQSQVQLTQQQPKIEHSASIKQLRSNKQNSTLKNNTSLNASSTSNNSPTKFKKQILKLSDLQIDANSQKKQQKAQPTSPLNKQSQLTPTRSQKMQKFGYFLQKQLNQNASSSSKYVSKTSESNLSQNLSAYNSNLN